MVSSIHIHTKKRELVHIYTLICISIHIKVNLFMIFNWERQTEFIFLGLANLSFWKLQWYGKHWWYNYQHFKIVRYFIYSFMIVDKGFLQKLFQGQGQQYCDSLQLCSCDIWRSFDSIEVSPSNDVTVTCWSFGTFQYCILYSHYTVPIQYIELQCISYRLFLYI